MITVKNLITLLKTLDDDFRIYAYEGEITGLIIVDKNHNEVGEIQAGDNDKNEQMLQRREDFI